MKLKENLTYRWESHSGLESGFPSVPQGLTGAGITWRTVQTTPYGDTVESSSSSLVPKHTEHEVLSRSGLSPLFPLPLLHAH